MKNLFLLLPHWGVTISDVHLCTEVSHEKTNSLPNLSLVPDKEEV